MRRLRNELEDRAEAELIEEAALRAGYERYSLIQHDGDEIGWFLDGDSDFGYDNRPAPGCWYRGMTQISKSAGTVLEMDAAADIADLDWRKTTLRKYGTDCGWIAPDGRWYECFPEDHDKIIQWLLKKSVGDVEKAGWVRVYGPPGSQPGGYDWAHESKAFLTVAQENRLSRLGHTVGP